MKLLRFLFGFSKEIREFSRSSTRRFVQSILDFLFPFIALVCLNNGLKFLNSGATQIVIGLFLIIVGIGFALLTIKAIIFSISIIIHSISSIKDEEKVGLNVITIIFAIAYFVAAGVVVFLFLRSVGIL